MPQVVFYRFNEEGVKIPEDKQWIMKAGISDEGVMYAPAICHPGGEMGALLCASHDGTNMVQREGHLYLPVDWLRSEVMTSEKSAKGKEKEKLKQVLDSLLNIEESIRAAHEEING